MIDGKLIKVCGMTDGENIRAVEALGADLIGFIFYEKSPRRVPRVPSYLPVKAGRVGVFVNAAREEILRRNDAFAFDYIQLHGSESPAFCHSLREKDGLKVIKAFSIADEDSRLRVEGYEGSCDLFLFDTRSVGYGGSGKRFDWSIMEDYAEKTPFFLSGGLGPDSVDLLREFSHPLLDGYDLNSRFEIAPGQKDTVLLQHFLNELKPTL